jgi:lipoprotein-releasing system permease protein
MKKSFLPLFLAWRYFTNKEKDASVGVMLKICFSGIVIGTFALMLTLIITNGFEKTIHEKMRGINAPIIMYSHGHQLAYNEIKAALEKDFGNRIAGISGSSIKQGIVDHNNMQHVLFLKGFDGAAECSVSTLSEKIVLPAPHSPEKQKSHLAELLQQDTLLIGYKTAANYGLHVGDKLKLLIPEPRSKKRLTLKEHTLTVAGIFNVGLEEYDTNVAFIHLETLHDLFNNEGVDQITVRLKNDNQYFENETLHLFQKRLPHLTICTWKEQYPALVSSLKLEKYVMFFVIALVTLVACMNMISLLFMQIQSKRRDIAIFKAMGFADSGITALFTWLGMTITLLASSTGLGLAALAGYLLERYPFIELPDVYYISHLPARMDAEIFLIVFFATILLGLIATLLATRQLKHCDILHVLRHE